MYNRKVHERLKEMVAAEIGSGDWVLECACGTGMLTEVMAPRCRERIATDLSEKMQQQARKKCQSLPNVEVRFGNILDLDFSDGSFDTVVAANVIHLLDEPEKALSELDRVCRPGGKLIIPTYRDRNPADRRCTERIPGSGYEHDSAA